MNFKNFYKNNKKGFTLLELLITFSIISILFMTSSIYITDVIKNTRLRNMATNLSFSFTKAKLIAIAERRRIMIMPINESWQKGWVVFEDKNVNGKVDNLEQIFEKFSNENVNIQSSKQNLESIIVNPVGLTNQFNFANNKISGLMANGTISFNFGNDIKCKNTYNFILFRNMPKICKTNKKGAQGCEC